MYSATTKHVLALGPRELLNHRDHLTYDITALTVSRGELAAIACYAIHELRSSLQCIAAFDDCQEKEQAITAITDLLGAYIDCETDVDHHVAKV